MKSKNSDRSPVSNMAVEIAEQPRCWEQVLATIETFADTPRGKRFNRALRGASRAILVGSGSSYHACLYGASRLSRSGIPSQAMVASMAFRSTTPMGRREVVVGVSHSGRSTDILEAMRRARQRGAVTLGLSNVSDTPLLDHGDSGLWTGVGSESAIPSTKGFTGFLLAFDALAELARPQPGRASGSRLASELRRSSGVGDELFDSLKLPALSIRRVSKSRCAILLGNDENIAVAMDGALKLAECAYMPSLVYPYGEFLHGPIALVDDAISVIALEPPSKWLRDPRIRDARKACRIWIQLASSGRNADAVALPSWAKQIRPYLNAVFVQKLAHDVATNLGHPVDTPRRLTKTVLRQTSSPAASQAFKK